MNQSRNLFVTHSVYVEVKKPSKTDEVLRFSTV